MASPQLVPEPDYKELFIIAAEQANFYAQRFLKLQRKHRRVLKLVSGFVGNGTELLRLLRDVNRNHGEGD